MVMVTRIFRHSINNFLDFVNAYVRTKETLFPTTICLDVLVRAPRQAGKQRHVCWRSRCGYRCQRVYAFTMLVRNEGSRLLCRRQLNLCKFPRPERME